jgi:hypothetical protein
MSGCGSKRHTRTAKQLALVRGADFGDAAWAGGKRSVSSTQGILELAPGGNGTPPFFPHPGIRVFLS